MGGRVAGKRGKRGKRYGKPGRRQRPPAAGGLDLDQAQPWPNSLKIIGIAGDDGLPGPSRANGDVSVSDVRRPGSGQQQANSSCVGPVKGHQVGAALANQPRQAGLLAGVPQSLGEGRGGDSHAHPGFHRARDQDDDATIVAV